MNSNCSTSVSIVEVGPRDGLQNEPVHVDLGIKLALIEQLASCGLKRIEAGAFVHPGRVPQMADPDLLFQQLCKSGARYSALVPNLKGLERAAALPVDEVAVLPHRRRFPKKTLTLLLLKACIGPRVGAALTHSQKST